MDSYSIAISGLTASQRAMDIIGNNISNAATEGYHRQSIELTPVATPIANGRIYSGGVDIADISRSYDYLLEQEITRQTSAGQQTSCQLDTLKSVESTLGDLSSESSLGTDIDEFFNAMQDLSLHPTDTIYQKQVVTAAQTLTSRFNSLGSYFNNLGVQISSQADDTLDQINSLTKKIAQLNGSIQDVELQGKQDPNIRDQRDKCISDLSKLIGIQTVARENGTVDVSINGTAVVSNRTSVDLSIKLQEGNKLGLCPAGDNNYQTDISGGTLGGLFTLKNQLLPGIQNQIDNLAETMIQKINSMHVQGLGSDGSFTSLTGKEMISQDLADFEPPVTDGKITVRVTDQTTGQVTRQSIDVYTTDTLGNVASKLDALSGIQASVVEGKLHIEAVSGYKFDFLPGVLSTPTTSTLSGTAVPTLSGIYTGSEDQTYTATVKGSGAVGVDSGLSLEVRDQDGNLVKTVNISQGYAAGSKVLIDNGIYVSVAAGTVYDGDNFTVQAVANSDTSGLLASAGINTFFAGTDAASIALDSSIIADPSHIAVCLGSDLTDNGNISALSKLGDTGLIDLNNKTFSDYYKDIASSLGQKIDLTALDNTNSKNLLANLANQQDSISGVDINDQAAELLVAERMFQASSKYLQATKDSIDTLMQIIS